MDREQAYQLLQQYMKNENLLKHSLAAEAAMKGIYKHLHGSDFDEKTQEIWGITGLLHDIDYEKAKEDKKLDKHGSYLFDSEEVKLPQDIESAIKSHNFHGTNVMPETDMEWGITCADQLTGLFVACALVNPNRKLEPLTVEFIQKRFNEKSFAKGADRKMISYCDEKLHIPLPKFIEICLTSMQEIHEKLGL